MDARSFTQHLGGRWAGHYGTAPCPVCQPDRRVDQNALTVHDGNDRLLVHCKKLGCHFQEILAAAGATAATFSAISSVELARRAETKRFRDAKRAQQAKRVWNETIPISGTLAEAYLRGRGLTSSLPDALRFHPACWHPTGNKIPAMVAKVDGADCFAIHRTFLEATEFSERPKKTTVAPAKAMLGSTTGGAVRLAEGKGPLVVAEGIETALSFACGLLPTPSTIWAALSTSGIRSLRLPLPPAHLIITADGDDAGRIAAQILEARACSAGWTVSLLPAPDGQDWNDVLNQCGGLA